MNDATLMTESEEPLDESEKTDLKVNIQRVKMVSGPITSWQIDRETMETVTDFILGGSRPTPVLLPGKIIWMEEPGRLQSMGSRRVGHD